MASEPWVYDGLTASRVADLVPGPDSSIVAAFPNYFVPFFEAFGSEALFTATDGVFGTELWRTDGTEAGTVRVSDIAAGPASLHLPIFWGGADRRSEAGPWSSSTRRQRASDSGG